MIVLVWSLVSSVVELARRRRLSAFLHNFLHNTDGKQEILVCTRIRPLAEPINNNRLVKFTSEPHLSVQRVLYRNEHSQVAVESGQPINPKNWRFVGSATIQTTDEVVYFMVVPGSPPVDQQQRLELPSCSIFLHSSCERIAWHRLQQASIYACSFDRFVDVVYAFSEGALFENNSCTVIESLQTLPHAFIPDAQCSFIGSNTQLAQKALPLLEQLFWGDGNSLTTVSKKFVSEQALHGHFGSLPRHLHISPRKRYKSCGAPRAISILSEFPTTASSVLFENNQLPPFIRHLDRERRYSINSKTTTIDTMSQSSTGVSPSITLEELDSKCDTSRLDDDSDIPFVDDSTVTSPLATVEQSSYAMVISRMESSWPKDVVKSNGSIMDKEDTISSDCRTEVKIFHSPPDHNTTPLILQNSEENSLAEAEKLVAAAETVLLRNASQSAKESELQRRRSARSPIMISSPTDYRRRHSAMPSMNLTDSREDYSARNRSLSPLCYEEYYNRRSLKKRGDQDAIRERGSFRRPYTPTRKFLSSRDSCSTFKVMYKPPSILVYTGEQSDLYGRIRENLAKVIPTDRYTVFNISAEAIKKQPWIEPTTACLVIADTRQLDDVAWAKMQNYFNQSGKIIFVCQNQLLASLTNCDSSKKQADILRMAFGSKDSVSMGKDFEQFLKKSLKSLTKNGHVNEKFHSKDLIGGFSYSVVLTKAKDCPLLLYMENSAHQASAIFSDATSEQLLAPGSKILPESLSRVGVSVVENVAPSFVPAMLLSKEDALFEFLSGVRYGEVIGLRPKLFIRNTLKVAEDGLPEATRDILPVEVCQRSGEKRGDFDFDKYFDTLKTNALGKICLYVPVCTTTMDVAASLCDAIPTCDAGVVIAGQQVAGQGRGGNEFVSPKGCAMFTCTVVISRNSAIAQNPSFIQHIFAVAIVDAVQRLSGLSNFPLRIKWPNDFYFNRSHKLGGLLATAKTRDNNLLITLGAGLNVTNSHPTVCLNDIVPEGEHIKFTVEEVVAESLNRFEHWMGVYEFKGVGEFLNKYYELWLHNREEVLLDDIGEKAVIRGLDKYGYLQVRSKTNPNKLFSVSDNGNTFDMMKGLIRQKIA